ncbi:uncharacterized protein J4E79_008732 [Alternaria viburni]|uniref:uncharacterized protein n=1 Tax=Alternaria viburni TaxID=566460 RepID=UPI0020C211E3|nr:uncharacterized protein J4E79_008732 [Alternaria viburni]KAI4653218.1 hypothetical protein J4E79_008732 [Alternaria viburni]
MRLLNARTYEFHDVSGAIKPNYAILSHTWEEDGEVVFEDIRDTSRAKWSAKKGYFKIKKTCEQALQDGCDFVWIDTCNINKDSSTELSEAINSMFRWYRDAVICYAYISDIRSGDRRSLSECRWLTRGWTLQEMIAPDRVHFYDMNWDYLGSRISLAAQLSESSGIHTSVLLRRHRGQMGFQIPTEKGHLVMNLTAELDNSSFSRTTVNESECQCCTSTEEDDVQSMLDGFSVAQKMKWASARTTTREEDLAYCLMGLFDVNMPLLYGEGKKAFYRLQKAILGISSDHSILAFRSDPSEDLVAEQSPLLASHPIFFRDEILNMHMPARGTHTTLSGTTLSVEMLICPLEGNGTLRDEYLGILDCSIDGDPSMRPAILLSPVHRKKLIFRRSSGDVTLFRLGSKHPTEAVLVTDRQLKPEERMLTREPYA